MYIGTERAGFGCAQLLKLNVLRPLDVDASHLEGLQVDSEYGVATFPAQDSGKLTLMLQSMPHSRSTDSIYSSHSLRK